MGGEALVVPTDVSDKIQIERLILETSERWGKVDGLISNAGQYIRASILEMTIPDLERSMAVNFYGHIHAVQAVLPIMLHQGSGHIILVATMDAKKGVPPDAPYVSAKCALSGFGDVARQELRSSGIAVTTLFPGRVDTPMIADLDMPWISAKISPRVSRQCYHACDSHPARGSYSTSTGCSAASGKCFLTASGRLVCQELEAEGVESLNNTPFTINGDQ